MPTMTQVASWEVLWMIDAVSGRSTRAIWVMGRAFRSRGRISTKRQASVDQVVLCWACAHIGNIIMSLISHHQVLEFL